MHGTMNIKLVTIIWDLL